MPEATIIGAAVDQSHIDTTTKADEKPVTESKESTRESAPADDDDSGWESPSWAKQWKRGSRKALRRLSSLDGAGEVLPDVYKELDNTYGYINKRDQEFANYRKRWDTYDPVIGALEKRFAMQGVAPQAGLQQLISVSEALERDPDNTIPWLMQQFRPRDINALIQNLAKTHNVDMARLSAAQPYIDPAVQGMIQPLQQQISALTGMLQNTQQQRYQEAAKNVTQAIQAFRSTTDEDGNPKYPHYERLEPHMIRLVQMGINEPLEKLYEQALWADPELREQLIEERSRKAQEKARQEAARRSAEAEQALGASRNVNGKKPGPRDNRDRSFSDVLAETYRELARKS